jgi:hypothetical protein
MISKGFEIRNNEFYFLKPISSNPISLTAKAGGYSKVTLLSSLKEW